MKGYFLINRVMSSRLPYPSQTTEDDVEWNHQSCHSEKQTRCGVLG